MRSPLRILADVRWLRRLRQFATDVRVTPPIEDEKQLLALYTKALQDAENFENTIAPGDVVWVARLAGKRLQQIRELERELRGVTTNLEHARAEIAADVQQKQRSAGTNFPLPVEDDDALDSEAQLCALLDPARDPEPDFDAMMTAAAKSAR